MAGLWFANIWNVADSMKQMATPKKKVLNTAMSAPEAVA